MHVRSKRRFAAASAADAAQRESGTALFSAITLTLGAALMYFFDPQRGRRRRALLRDRWTHLLRIASESSRVTSRDVRQRAGGLWAEGSRWFRHEDVSDDALVERVRAEMGRYVSHPHAIQVAAVGGRVTVSGPILAEEADDLLGCVRRVRGVRGVENRLEVHREAGNIPSLQGGRQRAGHRFELMQDNWSPAARVLTGVAGGMLLGTGYARRGIAGLALSLVGAGLLARSAANRDLASLTGLGARRGIPVQKTMVIQAVVGQVFDFWRNPENFPRCMKHVREVVATHDNRWCWRVDGPAGSTIEWEAEYTSIVPDRLIAWHTVPGSSVQHSGTVRFEADPRGGTRIDIQFEYLPPGGALGHAVARVFRADPKSEIDDDMMRMKTLLETGRAPHDAAQPAQWEGGGQTATAVH